jgi:ABC-2 type transport system ATP-binding protein
MIQIRNLTKSYGGVTVLNIPSLDVLPSQRFGLVGNNGAGKTTLFSLVLDLIQADGGSVSSRGTDVRKDGSWKQDTGSYLDESFVIDYLTPGEYFSFIGGLHGYAPEEVRRRLKQFEEFLTEEVFSTRKFIRELSAGNRKKVGITAALFFDPNVLILDEPFPHLDPTSVIRLKRILKEIAEHRNVTMLISSHDLNHVTEVCDRIALLEKGEIRQDLETTPETLHQLELYFAAQI